MAHFEQDFVDLRLPKSGKIRTTMSELIYHSDIAKEKIIVPKGIKTDLGSIPTTLQWLFPKDGKAVLAYILHDHLYKTGLFTRSLSDDILEEAMKTLDVKWWRRKGVRAGLKVGGWYAWNKHREKDNK